MEALYLVVSLQVVLLLWYVKSYLTESGKNAAIKEDIAEITRVVKKVEADFQIEFSRHTVLNELISKTGELLLEFQLFTDELVKKYSLQNVQDRALPDNEMQRWRAYASQINTVLARLYLTTPDPTYKFILEAVPDGIHSMDHLRKTALVSLRKAQFPTSSYLDSKFIRAYSVEVESKQNASDASAT